MSIACCHECGRYVDTDLGGCYVRIDDIDRCICDVCQDEWATLGYLDDNGEYVPEGNRHETQ